MMPADRAEREAVAAEYVIGVLDAAERGEFEQALARDHELQRAVYYWQDRLLPMARMLPPVEVSPALWPRIARSLQAQVRDRRAEGAPRWWQGVLFWRFGAVAASLLALVFALRLLEPAAVPVADGRYFAVLQSPDRSEAGWIVEAAAGGKLRLIPLSTTAVAPDRSLQFWTKPQGAGAPTSLGLVPGDRVTELDVSRLPALEPEQLFELTLEPPGGSPVGRPTGPILFVGRTAQVASR